MHPVIRLVRSLLLVLGLASLPACAAIERSQRETAPAPPAAAPQSAAVQSGPVGKITTSRTVIVYFDNDSAAIRAAAMQVLYGAAVELRGAKVTSIRVTGYTDGAGKRAYNRKLSERRAAAVADQLVKLGVRAQQVQTSGQGESKSTPRHNASDRKVEVTFELVQELAGLERISPAAPTLGGAKFSSPQTVVAPKFAQESSPPRALLSSMSPVPLRSVGKQDIKRVLVLDGTGWLPPPAA